MYDDLQQNIHRNQDLFNMMYVRPLNAEPLRVAHFFKEPDGIGSLFRRSEGLSRAFGPSESLRRPPRASRGLRCFD